MRTFDRGASRQQAEGGQIVSREERFSDRNHSAKA